MTLGETQKQAVAKLSAAGIESKHLDSSILLEKVTGRNRSWIMAHLDEPLSSKLQDHFMGLVQRRCQRIPLVHLTHSREFYGLDLFIDERVLTPRVETEKMVEYAVRYAPKNSRLIDIGTGSGALAVAIKYHRPDLEVWCTDVSDAVLEVAQKNIEDHKLDIKLVKASLFDGIKGRFATVVTNLPYLRDDADLMPEVRREPAIALFGGSDGLELYRKFLTQVPNHLEEGGRLFTECDPWQHAKLIEAAAGVGLMPIEQADYFILGFQLLLRR